MFINYCYKITHSVIDLYLLMDKSLVFFLISKYKKNSSLCNGITRWHRPNDVRVAGVCDGHHTHPEVFTAGSAQLHVVSSVVVDTSLGQHCIVLDFRPTERRGVVGDDYQFCLALPERLEQYQS